MRRLTRRAAVGALAASITLPCAAAVADGAEVPREGMTPEAARTRLVAGNARYARDAAQHCNRNYDRRAEVYAAQAPFAIVLGCSDSRVPPEVIFDQRLGDLFVVRLAGNIADDLALGSLEYAVEHFHSAIVLVLGHEKCGAVAATLEALRANAEPSGFVGEIVKTIMPAVRRSARQPDSTLHDAVRENVSAVVTSVRTRSALISSAERSGNLRLAGATYDLGDGLVTFL